MGIRQSDVPPEVWERLMAQAGPASRVALTPPEDGPKVALTPPRRKRRKPETLVESSFTETAHGGEWVIPLRLDPTANNGAIKRWLIGIAAKHRRIVAQALSGRLRTLARVRDAIDAGEPVACVLTRLGGRTMDDDGLPGTAKWVRDTVALFLGVSDAPSGPIRWEYRQEVGGPWGVKVELRIIQGNRS